MKSASPKIIICMLTLAFVGFFAFKYLKQDFRSEDDGVTYIQLRGVLARVEQEFFEARTGRPSLAEVKQSLLKSNGGDYLRSEVDRKMELKINPFIENWTNQKQNAIAVYSPVKFFGANQNYSYYVGITFSGDRTNISSLPNWKD